MASAGELKGLNVARRTCKAQLTMFSKFLERLDVSSGLGAEKIGQIIERLDKLEGTFERFGTIQSELELHADDYDDELAERDDFENRYFELKAKGKGLLQKFSRVDASTAGGTSQGAESPSPLDNIKLPVISLPTFSGDFKDWLGFRDLYLSLIHNNDRLSRIQKFHYLRASLRDAASRVLGTLELSEGNYDIAWTTLSERYDNKRVLVHIHLKTLVEVESMHRESAPKLRSLIDSVSKSLIALTALGQKPENWGVLVAYLISTKLDPVTERQWEEAKSTHKEVPSWDSLREFLSARADMLEAIDRQRGNNSKPERNVGLKPNKTSAKTFVGSDISCGVCKAKHSLVKCPSFLAMSPNERFGKVKQLKVCFNCLKPGHSVKDCRLRNCSKCPAKHHTLLHFEPVRVQDDASKPVESLEHQVSLSSLSSDNHVFLSTVLVDVVSAEGKRLKVRALLDSGSQSNFITSSLCKRLKTKLGDFEVIVGGLGSKASEVKHCCHIEVCARHSGYKSSLKCLVLPRITGFIPGAPVNISRLNIPSNITLADPEFSKPGPIDLLIGSELFYGLLCVGQISLGPHNPILQKTRFGWIVSGSMANPGSINSICNLSTNSRPSGSNIAFDLKKFWEVEDNFSETKAWSAEELECEEHFQRTHRRSVDGRFMVAIPFKHPVADLGNSKTKALHRFLSLERKLSRDSALREEYCSFMREYSSLGHMTRVLDEDDRVSYYMPHHPVIKTESCTTKLRVVFDCSMPSSTGKSLNDLQMVGPVIQSDLFDILIRFREFRFVVSADIAKMYRQVFVEPKQRSLQRIFWRESPSDPIEVFELNTVTYGQASASFLAVRCLHQVAQESELDVASVIKSSFYVDDFLHSINSVEEGIRMCHRVSAALAGGGFKLRKWLSNEPAILRAVSQGNEDFQVLDFHGDERAKILGLTWHCSSDVLSYKIQAFDTNVKVTKRTILSGISQVFDPLGLLCPAVIIAKILIQRLWQEGLSWDESVPAHLHTAWTKFRSELPNLNGTHIDRHIACVDALCHELHGFSDASEDAYGGAVYVRSIDRNGDITVRLLCAKSRVSPLKSLTIPRLELCGALVMAKLISKVRAASRLQFVRQVCWSDSTIVLSWLKMSPSNLKVFVSARISQIQTLTMDCEWRHVPTRENPADLVSRGVFPSELMESSLWWYGPSFLQSRESHWPSVSEGPKEVPEVRVLKRVVVFVAIGDYFFERYSDFNRLSRIVAYVLRFVGNCRLRLSKGVIVSTPLSSSELNEAIKMLVKTAQRSSFPVELDCLSRGVALHPKDKLLSLSPFLDGEGIMRVGGRLRNSAYQFNKKHPMLLSPKHRLTRMLCEHEHRRLMHAGPQLLLASLREKYWVVAARNLIRAVVRNCVTCSRFNPQYLAPLMGDLPPSRLTGGSVFAFVGVDYMGPLNIRDKRGRGARLSKCYVSVFICFATKALHLELVSDLSSESFLLAFRRFVARRGRPSHVYSDNGTNFVGANRELAELGHFLIKESSKLANSYAQEGVQWHFIPPQSPHFGGLWEAGVKSVKHHLKRVAGNANLTFEHLITLLAQIESILNSRPLSPLSQDPNDLTPLSPAHFLIGRSLTELPDPDLQHIPANRLSVFQRIQQIKQHFWTRWSKEYVSELQQRVKWKARQQDVQEGVLVLIKDDNLPPSKWRMGRVVAVHPGQDGVNRVATLRTSSGLVKRSFSKICPLPTNTVIEDAASASRPGAC
ncbi:uncharacterized protein [Euwallacea fornicatus]|uniref:uncharacterized protein n=1 Tax=Euwallacea fornicatus TaxID=995702 RepID=UPI00338E2386